MSKCSNIETAVKKNALGQTEQITYKWIGDSPCIYVTGAALDDMGIEYCDGDFWIGPYHLLKVDRYTERDEWLCVRADKLGALRVFFYRATRWLDWFYRRCIVVLAVFGLADYHDATIPGWRDIHFVQWLRRRKVVK